MMGTFQDRSRSSDAPLPETARPSETQRPGSLPSMEEFRETLQNRIVRNPDETFHEHLEIPPDLDDFQEPGEIPLTDPQEPGFVILDDGTVVPLPGELDIRRDDNGVPYLQNGELMPEVTYVLNGSVYKTDSLGRIVYCRYTPQCTPENPRDPNAQLQAGGQDRRPGDQGGHIVGRDLNGDGGAGNMVAMDSRINQSDYKRMENDVKSALADGKDVAVTTRFSYTGDSKRPDIITTTVTTDHKDTVYKFDNNLDGALKSEVPENGRDAATAELDATGGQISSIKEIRDENGNPVETIVSITYTDENGANHRTKVFIDAE